MSCGCRLSRKPLRRLQLMPPPPLPLNAPMPWRRGKLQARQPWRQSRRRVQARCRCVPWPPRAPACHVHETHTFTQIMLRFPDGKRLQRRFNGDAATTDDVYRWAEAEGVEAAQFRCAPGMPSRLATFPPRL